MEMIDTFIITCESNIIDIECFDIAMEGIDIKGGISWLLNKGKDLLNKFIEWARGVLAKLIVLINGDRLKKNLKDKCRNKEGKIYTFIKDVDMRILEYAFPGQKELNLFIQNNEINNINNMIEELVMRLSRQFNSSNPISADENKETADIRWWLENDLPKAKEVIEKGFVSNEEKLHNIEDENDQNKHNKKQCYEDTIGTILSNYKKKMSGIMNQYNIIKTRFSKIQHSIQIMNNNLNSLKSKIQSGEMTQDTYSKISKMVNNINFGVNATVVSHNAYMGSVAKASGVYINYMDRLTYGIDPNSKEAASEYEMPNYKVMQAAANTILSNPEKDSVLIKTYTINNKKVELYITKLFNSAFTFAGEDSDTVKQIEDVMGEYTPDIKFNPNGYTIVLAASYFDFSDKTPEEIEFIIRHEIGHIVHDDLKITKSGTLGNKVAKVNNIYKNVVAPSITGRYHKRENAADLYAIKSGNLSKNEFEKHGKMLNDEMKNVLANSFIDPDSAAGKKNINMMQKRVDKDNKKFNKANKY